LTVLPLSAVCVRIADERLAGAGRLEQHGLRICLERRGNRGELGGAHPALEFSTTQLRDEATQPVAVA
jgi:hypothetical protein